MKKLQIMKDKSAEVLFMVHQTIKHKGISKLKKNYELHFGLKSRVKLIILSSSLLQWDCRNEGEMKKQRVKH